MRRAVFLDRDGTVNREVAYLSRTEDLELLPGVVDALKNFQAAGYRLIIVSNQSGVARGYFPLRRMKKINTRLRRMLSRSGIRLDGVYACPWHHEGRSGPFGREHEWRKPSPGMLLAAAGRSGIVLEKSWMVGDRESDIAAGAAAGCRTVLVKTGYGSAAAASVSGWRTPPDFTEEDLLRASERILEEDRANG